MKSFFRVLSALATMGALTASAATFTVTNANASGGGSLQDAINLANGDGATDTITFNIPGAGVHVINQNGYAILTPMIIDATTQPGYAGAPLIEIDGGSGLSVIFTLSATATIRGFSLTNFREAIRVRHQAASSTIAGNYIGVDPDGVTANGGLLGITVNDVIAAPGDTHLIGGAVPADRNVISGNTYGVLVNGSLAIVSVQGNFIGTQADGSTALPNGIGITSSGPAVYVGGVAPNEIAHNTTDGVVVQSGATRIVSNSFFANGMGIDTLATGNANTATPVLTSAATTGLASQISGTLSVPTAPSTQFVIEFFSNPVSENQGRTLLGQTSVTTDGSGNAAFNAVLGPLTPGIFVTATATNDPLSETSEFATDIAAVTQTANLSITKTTTATSVSVGNFIDYTITVTNGGPDSATGVTVTDALPPNTTFVSATPTQGSCSGGSPVNCSLGTLANGASATIALRVMATAAGSATNTASASSAAIDPDGANAAAPAVAIANAAAIPTLSPALLLALAAMLAGIALLRK